ncbi:MAG: UMP kinase [Mycoplasmataceae bacterium]|nr:UMP kinase [Mycoplasmataceae bacterium]
MKKYKRILLKLSGEALGSSSSILDKGILNGLLKQIKTLRDEYDIEIAIVVGGGNIFRGQISENLGMGKDTEPADYMGMLATTINALGMVTFLNNHGVESVLQNSLFFEKISNGINSEEAKKDLKLKKIVVFGGGTGKPYLSTDTAASMRAIEIEADAILMAKNGVDGVYDDDPRINLDANFIPYLTFDEVIKRKLKVVDLEAMEMLKDKKIDLLLFNMNTPNNIINLYKDINTRKTIISEK